MSFWSWALEAYARPGVAPACLDLQDRDGQSVPYLLWAAWAAREGRTLAPSILEAAAVMAQSWEQSVIQPLRLARRGLAPGLPGADDQDVATLRQEVKALELRAERMLMQGLEALAPEASAAALPLEPGLSAASSAWATSASQPALRRLIEALD
jgi:uncharacterized protein (TIGR02444 family)